jgi:hypothetical protein
VLELLASGALHLAGVCLLAPHLTASNADTLLAAARGRSKRQIEELVAGVAPRPDVPDQIRKLPARRDAASAPAPVVPAPVVLSSEETSGAAAVCGPVAASPAPMTGGAPVAGNAPVGAEPPLDDRRAAATPTPVVASGNGPATGPQAIAPLGPARDKVTFTAGRPLVDKLQRARDLDRHRVPSGDMAALVERAIDLLLTDLERRRFAARSRQRARRAGASPETTLDGASPGKPSVAGARPAAAPGDPERLPRDAGERPPSAPGDPERLQHVADERGSAPDGADRKVGAPQPRREHARARPRRAIPAAVRRAVRERDGERCTYVSPDGRRCGARAFLEFGHVVAHASGGAATADNLVLLCRTHNQYQADQAFGAQFMVAHRQRSRTRGAGERERPSRAPARREGVRRPAPSRRQLSLL